MSSIIIYPLPKVSIFTAETQAIKEALIFGKSTFSNKIEIISDSLSGKRPSSIEAPNPSNEIITISITSSRIDPQSNRIHVGALSYGHPWK